MAEPNKLYKVQYTGWLAADGHKFDSSYDHPAPVLDKDGKPVMGDDGKPKMGDPQPFTFPQGFGRVIPGWDQGFDGMKIGGKRRLFIPWQLAYGAHGHPTGDPKNPGIPPKADLIFDVELVDVTDMPPPTNHPGMGGMPGRPMPGGNAPRPSAPAAAATPAAPATPAKPATPASPATPTAPATQAAPTTPATPPQPPVELTGPAPVFIHQISPAQAAPDGRSADRQLRRGRQQLPRVRLRGFAHNATASPVSTSRPRSITAIRVLK